MELLNRYLQAVKWWLPRQGQDDILRELSEDLHSQIDDKQAVLGRNLTDSEVAEILKKQGNPFLVASRFRTDQDWIAAPWLQLYRFVMKVVLLWVLTPILAIVYVPAIVTAKNPAAALLSASGHIWLALIYAVGMVTVAFGAVRWLKPDLWALKDWDPLNLPPPKDPLKISRLASALEVLICLMFLSFWMALPHVLTERYDVAAKSHWTTPTLWLALHGTYYWFTCLIMAAGIAISAVNFVQPTWTRNRMFVKAGLDGIVALFVAVVLIPEWGNLVRQFEVMVDHRGLPEGQVASADVNLTIGISLLIVAIVSTTTCVTRLRAARALGHRSEPPAVLTSLTS